MSTITAGDLTLAHVGQVITIEAAGATVTGRLRGFEVETDWIDERSMVNAESDPVAGRQTVRLAVGQWEASVPLAAAVDVEGGAA